MLFHQLPLSFTALPFLSPSQTLPLVLPPLALPPCHPPSPHLFLSFTSQLDFMKKFGYVEKKGDNTTDFVFTNEALREALLRVQEFGGIEQTGELDENTVKVRGREREKEEQRERKGY